MEFLAFLFILTANLPKILPLEKTQGEKERKETNVGNSGHKCCCQTTAWTPTHWSFMLKGFNTNSNCNIIGWIKIKILNIFKILEFQGPILALRNSSPCSGHVRSARMASRFARKVTLKIWILITDTQTLHNFIIRFIPSLWCLFNIELFQVCLLLTISQMLL